MKILFLSTLAATFLAGGASPPLIPAEVDWSEHQYSAPGPGDLRGPCPGLNTLANHGFLPRNGKGLTPSIIIKASLDGFNVQPDVVSLPAKIGFTASTDPNFFTLDDIKLHNSIEHDASVSRGDAASGDNLHFNETLFQTLAGSNPGVDYYNGSSAGEVQRLRLLHSQATNPNSTNTRKEFSIRIRESALYLSVMGNVTAGMAPKQFVNIFFREERLPLAEGWRRSPTPISGDTMQSLSSVISRTSQWTADVGKDSSIIFVVDEDSFFTV